MEGGFLDLGGEVVRGCPRGGCFCRRNRHFVYVMVMVMVEDGDGAEGRGGRGRGRRRNKTASLGLKPFGSRGLVARQDRG